MPVLFLLVYWFDFFFLFSIYFFPFFFYDVWLVEPWVSTRGQT